LESARKLLTEMLEDPDLAQEVTSRPSLQDRWALLKARGYDFSQAEWGQVSDELSAAAKKVAGGGSGELGEDQLEAVFGGASSWLGSLSRNARNRLVVIANAPSIRMVYGDPDLPGSI
jgi:predicted ribosomally synthesized peptide with nif11-like leader